MASRPTPSLCDAVAVTVCVGGQGLGVGFDLFSWVVKLSECSLWKLNPRPPLPYGDFCLPPLPTPACD